jgi:RIO-like serine/threonine protein kinase
VLICRHGGTVRCLKNLLRSKLVHHDNSIYDSYRLTNLGYDFLAIKALVNRGCLASIGRQIGVGKESDVFEVRLPITIAFFLPLPLAPSCLAHYIVQGACGMSISDK